MHDSAPSRETHPKFNPFSTPIHNPYYRHPFNLRFPISKGGVEIIPTFYHLPYTATDSEMAPQSILKPEEGQGREGEVCLLKFETFRIDNT